MQAKVAQRGQVTIPKSLRDQLAIHPGTILEFHTEQGKLIAVKTNITNPVDELFGSLGSGRKTDEIMATLRDDS
ncbi:MAG: AbrB/MazE/SpoVT family DNA-binding domain-containing protein [Magnetococcales bacterium]|nr:AbrB/MazE/SpoVT family DNA-binding domain-containing protein [Magnetococcales bacterium]